MLEEFSKDELLLLSQVLDYVISDYEDFKEELYIKYCEACFNLMQKVIRNIGD
jgi:hypothetical protein